MNLKSAAFAFLLASLLASPLRADVKLPAIFGDHMVLQSGAKVPIWGWADPGEKISITATGGAGAAATAVAGPEGKWTTTLDNLKASDQPIDVTVAGKNTITLHDVLVGDVWVCSGQSNMEFSLSLTKFTYGGAVNFKDEAAKANHPTLRLFLVHHKIATEPQNDCVGNWTVCTPETAATFSAVGYFFARDILEARHVPVGMIGTYWGGTAAQVWTSLEAIQHQPKLSVMADDFLVWKENLPDLIHIYKTQALPKWKQDHAAWRKDFGDPFQQAIQKWNTDAAQAKAAHQPLPPKPQLAKPEPPKPVDPNSPIYPTQPSILYNGMVAPIIPYAIKGAIWYQGESNAGNPKQYETLFPTMITDWRTRWAQGDFPFIWVQLANFMGRLPQPTQTTDWWPGLREAQSRTLRLPNTAQAVIIDLGMPFNIHPTDKLDVGHRLALAARHIAYGEDLVYSGPTYDSFQIEDAKIQVKFKNIGSGLTIASSPAPYAQVSPQSQPAQLRGFSIAGKDRRFVWADAAIEGDTVVVSSPDVPHPVAVRYGWAANPDVNLYNKEGLPACPFRTDTWTKKTPQLKQNPKPKPAKS